MASLLQWRRSLWRGGLLMDQMQREFRAQSNYPVLFYMLGTIHTGDTELHSKKSLQVPRTPDC